MLFSDEFFGFRVTDRGEFPYRCDKAKLSERTLLNGFSNLGPFRDKTTYMVYTSVNKPRALCRLQNQKAPPMNMLLNSSQTLRRLMQA
jgi:hypothetical protein